MQSCTIDKQEYQLYKEGCQTDSWEKLAPIDRQERPLIDRQGRQLINRQERLDFFGAGITFPLKTGGRTKSLDP